MKNLTDTDQLSAAPTIKRSNEKLLSRKSLILGINKSPNILLG
jgi:hypothetical protein